MSTSYRGSGHIPDGAVAGAAGYVLLHGNGSADPDLIAQQVERTRRPPGYHTQPILFSEDDHSEFSAPWNNCVARGESARVMEAILSEEEMQATDRALDARSD